MAHGNNLFFMTKKTVDSICTIHDPWPRDSELILGVSGSRHSVTKVLLHGQVLGENGDQDVYISQQP